MYNIFSLKDLNRDLDQGFGPLISIIHIHIFIIFFSIYKKNIIQYLNHNFYLKMNYYFYYYLKLQLNYIQINNEKL